MNKKQILEQIDEAIEYVNLDDLSESTTVLLKAVKLDEACELLAQRLNANYSTVREGATAVIMQTIIRVKPGIGMVAFPDNYFFQLALLRGSKDLYECYVEEVMDVCLKSKSQEEITDRYFELYSHAQSFAEQMFPKYKRVLKGTHFNGAFGEHSNTAVIINSEDYHIMDDVVERYNAIVGRREIIADLLKKTEV